MHNQPADTDPALTPETDKPAKSHWQHLHRFKEWYGSHKKWSIPVTIIVLLAILAAVPWTRYNISGLFLKKTYSVQVTDSTAHIPVSGATVSIDSVSASTNGSGIAFLHGVKVGSKSMTISKKYYQDNTVHTVVPILAQKNSPDIMLVATGRQAKIHVTNLINKKVLADVNITVAGAKAKTDSSGNALVVLPVGSKAQEAKLSLNGYGDTSHTVQVSDSSIKENNFTLTPSGKLYFLSKLSGNIDVVKTNLDGTDRQTVIAGTGKEDDQNTVLLASTDWQYLALLSSRSTTQPSLYVINTKDDKLLDMDEGNATFTPVGWSGHYFVYTVSRNGYNSWQPHAFSIKSYNADTGQTLTLASTGAQGTSDFDAEYENFFYTYIVGNNVIFARTWYKAPGYLSVDGKNDVLAAIHPDGTGSRQLKSVDASMFYISNLRVSKSNELDFAVYSNDYSQPSTYFTLDNNGNVSQNTTLTDEELVKEPDTYLQSPSGNLTFWSDERDGKNTLFVGDQDGNGAKQIATLSGYSTYGWYTDNYLLVSKNASELYIIPASGIKNDSDAIKATDYHKPAQSFYGYGDGYGGL